MKCWNVFAFIADDFIDVEEEDVRLIFLLFVTLEKQRMYVRERELNWVKYVELTMYQVWTKKCFEPSSVRKKFVMIST